MTKRILAVVAAALAGLLGLGAVLRRRLRGEEAVVESTPFEVGEAVEAAAERRTAYSRPRPAPGPRPKRKHRPVKLDDHLPRDHRLVTVYRIGASLGGLFLVVFGVLGLSGHPGFLDTSGDEVAGLSSNGALSVASIVVGAVLLVGALVGGNTAANVNTGVGILFFLGGFVGLAILDSEANFLAFRMSNVIFSFVFGLVLLTFGLYGRVTSHLPHDNPYWQEYVRNPEYLPSGPPALVRILRPDPGPPHPTRH